MKQVPPTSPDLSQFSPEQQARVLEKLEELQIQDSMNTFNGLVQRCFNQCVTSFRSKDLDKQEAECVNNCVLKFMSFSQRIGQRLVEKSQEATSN
jgi:mitochondrial import inner membrane translocase subunit TIM9